MDNIETVPTAPPRKSWWRKIVDFPLVAMVIALAAIIIVVGLMSFGAIQIGVEAFPEDAAEAIFALIATLGAIITYKLFVRRLGEEPRDDLPFDRRSKDFWRGLVFAGLLMTAIVGVTAALGGYSIAGWGGSTSWAFLLFAAGFQAAFFEEIIARGIIFHYLEQFGGSWFALVISSLIFGFLHAGNDNATTLSSFAIAVEAGTLLGGAYMLTRNLWLAIGLHFGWNVVQGYLWDVPVSGNAVDGLVDAQVSGPEIISGGAFGLEASAVAMVMATAAGLWLVYKAAQHGNIVKPWWTRRAAARADVPVDQTKL
ncbi:CPBP family intramembrane glutamic endopeptidase [Qipengyuania marisflavi]|uniref:CPBP family intramembrane metalloprotease n=1 Tax=Qipengyuania marisflavi TaxID=2486356 RepID=A0A5S3PFI6_9SPHN|nr:CPBP family intramembrane glutamic endopeptidase [Qipengyuania marisflavi]TMM50350.1 CPBP family intramembrane metalloprotease [Qipengyuania marisflavi]